MTIRTESRIPVAGSVSDVWAYMCDVGHWQGQIQRVNNIEMAAIKAAVESDVQTGAGSP